MTLQNDGWVLLLVGTCKASMKLEIYYQKSQTQLRVSLSPSFRSAVQRNNLKNSSQTFETSVNPQFRQVNFIQTLQLFLQPYKIQSLQYVCQMKITEVQCIQTCKMTHSGDKLLHVWAGHLLISFPIQHNGVISKSVSLQIDIPVEEVADVDPFCQKIINQQLADVDSFCQKM